jgi:hypothetical protein
MATVLPSQTFVQGVLSIGNNLIHTAPTGYYSVVGLRFNNSVAYDITVSLTRVSPPSTEQLYSITLDAGDTVEDAGYTLFPGDSITVSTTVAGTVYFVNLVTSLYYRNA